MSTPHTPECTCHVNFDGLKEEIDYCELHASVYAMRDALMRVLDETEHHVDCGQETGDCDCALKDVRAALAATTPEAS